MELIKDSTYKKQIGIMGGTFNPIHNGHLSLAEHAYEQYQLDKILFMPAKNPAHKQNEPIAEEQHRVNMISLAIEPYSFFEFSSIELHRSGITYTYDTLLYMTEQYPETEFYFLLGADSLFHIEKWYRSQEIMRMARILVSERHSYDYSEVEAQIEYLKNKFRASIGFVNMPEVPVSSHEIRMAVADHETNRIAGFVSSDVLDYMLYNKLYQKDGGFHEI